MTNDKNRKALVRTLKSFGIKPNQTRWLVKGEALPELDSCPEGYYKAPEEWPNDIFKGPGCAVLCKRQYPDPPVYQWYEEFAIQRVALYPDTNPRHLAELLAPYVFGEGADWCYPKAL